MDWNNIVNLNELDFEEHSLNEHYVSKEAYMAKKMGAKKLGFHVEILPPGKFSSPYHFHHCEEELFWVLEGKAILRQNGKFKEVKKGDLIFFATGPEGAHHFYNHTQEPFQYLALSTIDPLEVCEYPDSNKVYARAIKKVFPSSSSVDYLQGEEDPSKYWPADLL